MTQIVADIEAFISAPIRLAALIRTWRRRGGRRASSPTSTLPTGHSSCKSTCSAGSMKGPAMASSKSSSSLGSSAASSASSAFSSSSSLASSSHTTQMNNINSSRAINLDSSSATSAIASRKTPTKLSNNKSKARKSTALNFDKLRDYDSSNHLTVSSILNGASSTRYQATLCSLLALLLLLLTTMTATSYSLLFAHATTSPISKHSPYYLDFLPASTHFSYAEGRQSRSVVEFPSSSASNADDDQQARSNEQLQIAPSDSQAATGDHLADESHGTIHKRSSALLPGPPTAQYLPLVSSMHMLPAGPMLSRRIMMMAAQHQQDLDQSASDLAPANYQASRLMPMARSAASSGGAPSTGSDQKHMDSDRVLLRQKQHIQYHDQWPSMAGKCHKRTLNFCASVLPFNSTTFPNIIGDTNRFEVKRSLPFFGFLAKSSCNKRLDELLCLLLEPPCHPQTGVAIPPCKKFCRLALEGCNEYIPATLALSSVFDCRQYPDSNEPGQCVNLAQGSKCSQDEFKCPDETCIPRNWLCDGVRDCVFAADEANCTETGAGLGARLGAPASIGGANSAAAAAAAGPSASGAASICSTEEFKCDAKCVPKAWKCDGERDCLDGTDEEDCERRPRCGADRFRCADGNGCIPKRWVCDGKAECRDGSDEMNCAQRECSQNDFKCDNGICIPSLWRCDKQNDCKDGSDERGCRYPEPSTTTSTTTTTTTTTTTSAPPSTSSDEQYSNATASSMNLMNLGSFGANQEAGVNAQTTTSGQVMTDSTAGQTIAQQFGLELPYQAGSSEMPPMQPQSDSAIQQQDQQFESSLVNDVARIIQQEIGELKAQTSSLPADLATASSPIVPVSSSSSDNQLAINQQQQQLQQQAATKPDASYDIIGMAPVQQQHQTIEQQQQPIIEPATFAPINAIEQLQSDNANPSSLIRQQAPLTQSTPAIANPSIENGPNNPLAQQRPNQDTNQATQNQQHQQRVPMYRNLFKSFKGVNPNMIVRRLPTMSPTNQAIMQQQQQPLRPNVQFGSLVRPGSRRRRERYELSQQQRPQLEAIEGPMSNLVAPVSGDGKHAAPSMVGGEPQMPAANSTRSTGTSNLSNSVSGYLQLLNSRYHHLRHNRAHH